MVYFSSAAVAAVAAFFANQAFAHPGHDIREEMAERAAFLSSAEYTNLDHCAEQLEARSTEMIARRKAMVDHLRTKRGIVKRDFNTVLATNHHSNASVTPNSPSDVIFAGNSSCILQAEATEGPYCMYIDSGPT